MLDRDGRKKGTIERAAQNLVEACGEPHFEIARLLFLAQVAPYARALAAALREGRS